MGFADKYKIQIRLLPFLVLYILVCFFFSNNTSLTGDEPRYWGYAQNLLNGFYAFENNTFLWNGPGYPLVLLPFRALDTPLIFPKLLNAFLLYFSLVLFCKTLMHYLSEKKSLWLAALLGLYYPGVMDSVPYILTEALAFFCSTAFMFCVVKVAHEKNWKMFSKNVLMASGCFALLTLTKVIFGYVLLATVLCGMLLFVYRKTRPVVKPYLIITLLAIVLCSPYLFYTYSLTGKVYYWGNSGSSLLYWISSPYEGELGDWHQFNLKEHPKLAEHHSEFINSTMLLNPVERDAALKRKAIENIKNHPKKFVENWVANVGRLFFSYPLSYIQPSVGIFYFLVPNIFLIVFMFLAGIITMKFWKKIPVEILFLVFIFFVYLGGTSLISAFARFLYLAIPPLLLWIAFVFSRYLKVNPVFSTGRNSG